MNKQISKKKKATKKITLTLALLLIFGICGYSINKQLQIKILKQPGKVIYSGQTFRYYDKITDQILRVDWGKISRMPESNINEKAFKTKETFKIVELIKALELPQQEQLNIFQSLGLKQEIVNYYNIANTSYQERFALVVNALKQKVKTTDDFVKIIADGKVEINGKAIVTQDILDQLLKEGYINNAFKNYLDSLRFNPITNKVESDQRYQPQGQKLPMPEFNPSKMPITTNCYKTGFGQFAGVSCTTY